MSHVCNETHTTPPTLIYKFLYTKQLNKYFLYTKMNCFQFSTILIIAFIIAFDLSAGFIALVIKVLNIRILSLI